MKHNLQLATQPFRAIVAGRKTIESRLYDQKRQKIQLGDEIIFINRDDAAQTIMGKIVGLLRYENFENLFKHNEPAKFGGSSVERLMSQIEEFYSIDEQERYGVLGIEFVVDRE